MVFSAQQVKFEFLSYIKEFGGDPTDWRIGSGTDAQGALFERNGIDRERDIWLWKPTPSPAAANIVLRFFIERMGVPATDDLHLQEVDSSHRRRCGDSFLTDTRLFRMRSLIIF
jgi:hypothetical protein